MNNKVLLRSLIILLAIGLLGIHVPARAEWGMGYGHHPEWECPMYGGMHPMHYGGPGFGYGGGLSEEDLQKLEKERLNFFEATRDIRGKLYQKRLEIKSELAKETPDAKKAADLQKEISELRAELGQKRLTHFFNVRKIIPDAGRGFRGGYGMMGHWGQGGYGMMGPGMMGYGESGYGMMGSGMMGNMMGPGMMGYGERGGYGMMGPDRGYPQRYGRHMGSLEEIDARKIVENYIASTRNPNLKVGKIIDSGKTFRARIVTRDDSLVEEVLIDKESGSMRSAY